MENLIFKSISTLVRIIIMKFKTGLVSLLVVCGACSQATKETDVVKDSFDFAGQQLKYAFTQIDSAQACRRNN
jgi:hypothetical protein